MSFESYLYVKMSYIVVSRQCVKFDDEFKCQRTSMTFDRCVLESAQVS